MKSKRKRTAAVLYNKPTASDLSHQENLAKKEGDDHGSGELVLVSPPIASSYNDRIRPVLDAVDKLRNLAVMEEGVQLPTIVVVGDQSSVIESLAGINLPRGQGICTRVPLIMRLQNHSSPLPALFLEYDKKVVRTDEEHVSQAINKATQVIAGPGKKISKTPLTLVVKKKGIPDLTMVDLPGITRVPVHGQPENIYDQIKDIIMEYIKPEESIILNVLSATVDFPNPTCESIRMSQSVDKTGERTLAVVTKSDKSPEGLKEKVTADDVNIGLGYVCVRNRVGNESYEDARVAEAKLFESHPLLSKIDKSIVGIPVLAQKLMEIQARSIARNLTDIVKKINDKLSHNISEFKTLPKAMSSMAEAMSAFRRVIGQVKESLRKILLRGEFDEYPNDKKMHCKARLVEILNDFFCDLKECPQSNPTSDFLMDEIKYLEEAKEISLPNFFSRTIFLSILQEKVNGISSIPTDFVKTLWSYIEEVVMTVLMSHVQNYYQLQLSAKRAGLNLIEKMKENSMKWVSEVVEMEKLTDYTCNPEFEIEYKKLMAQKDAFMRNVYSCNSMNIEGLGLVDLVNPSKSPHLLPQAFDLRMKMVAYWNIVLTRFVDSMALHLQLSVHKLVNDHLERELVAQMMAPDGNGLEKMMDESPLVATKRAKLDGSINKLKECKEILAKIMDRTATTSCGE
ncbi:dynamin-related protein 4C-like [Humulus lupulus]|uniref:dynamin-related protein 4C-like n=1 Tax=Humulus lupulus TaxID=3486 RepID=UPI002B414D11|nr:dynamin-related protein 4C-like [Humulus lupulus]